MDGTGSIGDSLFDSFSIHEVGFDNLPSRLSRIPSPPQSLFVATGSQYSLEELLARPKVAIVGSRKLSDYGHMVTTDLAGQLAARGVVIVSGLAIGVDAVAHRAALDAHGLTMAILPSPIEQLYPRTHLRLAHEIITAGGAIASEYPAGSITFKTNFVARNRLVTALADTLLITEAAEKSGTMHTARFAIDQGIPVMAVPGNISSPTSEGTNNLIKSGAIPITTVKDILNHLTLPLPGSPQHVATPARIRGSNPAEQRIVDLLEQGITEGSDLLASSQLSIEQFNHHLTMLEITAKVRPLGANRWALS
jgi:DNA processing protein